MRNPHNDLADFHAEMPLYERSGALVEYLVEYSKEEVVSATSGGLTPTRIERLAVTMYEYGIVDIEDVALTQVGLVISSYRFWRRGPL